MFNIFLCALMACSVVAAQQLSPSPERLTRLQALADLWGKLYLFHPGVVRPGVDCDRALVETIPRVEAARTAQDLAAALNEHLLRSLGDPLTVAQVKVSVPNARPLDARKIAPVVGFIDASDPRKYKSTFAREFVKAYEGLGNIESLVVDLRYPTISGYLDHFMLAWLGVFIDSPRARPQRMRRAHEGWNQFNGPSNFVQKWQIDNEPLIIPTQRRIKSAVLFLVNNTSYPYLRGFLGAIQAQSRAAVIWEQTGNFEVNEADPDDAPEPLSLVSFPMGVQVAVNTAVLLSSPRQTEVQPDIQISEPVSTERMIEYATRISTLVSARAWPSASLEMSFRAPEQPSMRELSREEKLLALIKLWSVIRYVYPHKDLISGDWDTALSNWIPRAESAASLRDFYDSMAELCSRLNDAHVFVAHPSRNRGAFDIPVRLERIEGKVIVTRIRGSVPVKPGDEVLAIDNTPAAEIDRWWRSRTSAPTERVGDIKVWPFGATTRGAAKDSPVTLRVRSQGREKVVTINREPEAPWRSLEPAWTQSGNVGIINLERIPNVEAFDAALVALHEADGLVLRGIPSFAEELMRRLISQPLPGKITEFPLAFSPDLRETAWVRRRSSSLNPLPGKRYSRPVVVLIDGSLQSSAEGWISALQEVGVIVCVGTPTAGANGNVTFLRLPGGGQVRFTGMKLLHSNGSRFQNIGVIPDVFVEPTSAGVVAGRDEVLEKGVETVKTLIKLRSTVIPK